MRRALGLTLLLILTLPAPAAAQREREVRVVLLDVASEPAVSKRVLQSIALRGGVGLVTETEPMAAVLENLRSTSDVSVLSLPGGGLFRDLESVLRSRSDRELLVLAIDRAAETDGSVMRLFMGRGTAGQLQRGRGTPPGLTSDTTRRAGVVSNIDLLPTALEFLGAPIPDELPGAPIRVEGEAPTELHERYLEYRRVVVPVGVAVLTFTLSALAVALVLLLTGRGGPGLSRLVAAWGVLGVSLQVALLPGSWLPTYRPWVVAVVLVAIGVAVAALAWWVGRGSPIRVPAAVAGLGLGLVVVDDLLGWRSLLTPLLGGSALDGVRFYGLGNPYAGMVLAGAVLLAALLPPVGGLVLLLGAALFAGLPFLGADLGGGVTLLAVAGLWYGLRWRRSGWWALGGSVIGGVAGAILLILAHRFLPGEPTHVTRAVEGAGGVTGVAEVFLDRLRLNLEATAATPAIWPALAGIPVALWLALIRPGPFRAPLERFDEWRLGVIALAVGGMLGYVLNDTYGMASVSFIYLALALVYPALAERWTSA